MCCSARPASSRAPSVLPEDRIGHNIICIRRFCDHKCPYFRPDLYCSEVRLEVYDVPAWSFFLLPCPRLTPRHHRQGDGQLSPRCTSLPSLTSFGAACVKLCGLPRPSLDRTTVAAVSSSLHRKYKVRFELNMNIKQSIIFSNTVDAFTAKVERGADRAPQITASFTRDRRRAHSHIVGEAWTGPNRCPNGHESAVRVQA